MKMWGVSFKMNHLPLLVGVWFIAVCVIGYTMSVSAGRVYHFFPYISDTVVFAPERCMFAQMMFMGNVFLGLSMYVRYRQIKMYLDMGYITNCNPIWNNIAFVIGIAACLSATITVHISEADSLLSHVVAAAITIIFLILYFTFQTKISYDTIKLKEELPLHGITKRRFYFRLFLISTVYILVWTLIITGILSARQFTGSSHLWWTEKEGGYKLHLISAFSEWLIFIVLSVYSATLTDGLEVFHFKKVVIELKDSNHELKKSNESTQKLD